MADVKTIPDPDDVFDDITVGPVGESFRIVQLLDVIGLSRDQARALYDVLNIYLGEHRG